MSELKLISPLLDNLEMGDPISDHDGVQCCPAMAKDSDEKYIVKVISVPASPTQLDALLLTGAYATKEEALAYFKELAGGIEEELQILQRLSRLEGFLPAQGWQTVPMESGDGYNVYVLSTYKRSLERYFGREAMTHLGAINLGLDLCAAMAVCRRAGYLYVDLKPGNIYVTDDREYRIGDAGFVRLDALKYASMPDKYRSAYTAPEVVDPFASLNDTVDIYAIGLILYQAYNNGALPVIAADGTVAPPEYADYEMAEIILKACAADPAERWQDPIKMGQALVSYMQRNGANDVPIVPIPVPSEETPEDTEPEADTCEEALTPESDEEIAAAEAVEEQIVEATDIPAEEPSAEDAELPQEDEDDIKSIAMLLDTPDETDPVSLDADMDAVDISDEVTEILTQAEALEDIEVPDPVIPPEPIDVPMPEPIAIDEPEAADAQELPAEQETDTSEQEPQAEAAETPAEPENAEPEETPSEEKKPKKRWLLPLLLSLVGVLVIIAAIIFYRSYYLLPIHSIKLDGSENNLIVSVESNVEDGHLSVVCSDSHGNQLTAPVIAGKATFENLSPNTAYNIKVVAAGFHKLTGSTATAYSTPIQTNIVQFSAVTGAEDGSVILGFTVDGPSEGNWSIVYGTDGEVTQTVTAPSHMVTLTGLTIGKEYFFRLLSDTQLYVTGTDEITFTARRLVYAQNLHIPSLVDGSLTAVWSAPEDADVTSWTVRCFNDSDYNETIITSDTTAVFEQLDQSKSYTVEVTAAGQSVSQRAFVAENALTVSNFQVDASDPAKLVLTWDTVQGEATDGWLLRYALDGAEVQNSLTCTESRAEITAVVPGASYSFTLQEADGTAVLAEQFAYTAAEASAFSGYNVTPANMSFKLYKVSPKLTYTDTFSTDDNIYLLIDLQKRTTSSQDRISVVFAVRDSSGKVISCDSTTLVWSSMWDNGDCILAIPRTPQAAGSYSVSIYFAGQLVTTQAITVTE